MNDITIEEHHGDIAFGKKLQEFLIDALVPWNNFKGLEKDAGDLLLDILTAQIKGLLGAHHGIG